MGEVRLDANKIGIVRRASADVTSLCVPEHDGDRSALPMLAQRGNFSLEIWSSALGHGTR
jgi:hypothetical protein